MQDVKDSAEAEAKALEEKAAAAADTLKTEAATKAADIIQKVSCPSPHIWQLKCMIRPRKRVMR